MDLVLLILSIVALLIGAFGTYRADPRMVALGWVGIALFVLTFITS